jgi:hypothetical protein
MEGIGIGVDAVAGAGLPLFAKIENIRPLEHHVLFYALRAPEHRPWKGFSEGHR